jgi:hypothetical protein
MVSGESMQTYRVVVVKDGWLLEVNAGDARCEVGPAGSALDAFKTRGTP